MGRRAGRCRLRLLGQSHERADLLYGPNFVLNANYELRRETHDQHTYPIDGWSWFDSEEDARLFFDLPAPTDD